MVCFHNRHAVDRCAPVTELIASTGYVLLLACEAALPQQGRGLRLFGQLLKRDSGASAHIRSIELQRAF